jgi:UDP-N-acetylmuramate--alanine ligase
MKEFATAFGDADSLLVLDIYAANEPPIEGITGEALAQHIEEEGERPAHYVASFAEAAAEAVAAAHEGDMILTLGAGSVSQLGPMILAQLAARTLEPSLPR